DLADGGGSRRVAPDGQQQLVLGGGDTGSQRELLAPVQEPAHGVAELEQAAVVLIRERRRHVVVRYHFWSWSPPPAGLSSWPRWPSPSPRPSPSAPGVPSAPRGPSSSPAAPSVRSWARSCPCLPASARSCWPRARRRGWRPPSGLRWRRWCSPSSCCSSSSPP